MRRRTPAGAARRRRANRESTRRTSPAKRRAVGTKRGARPLLLIATFNAGKAREIARLLEPLGLRATGLANRGVRQPHEETGATYEENAAGKARHYAAATGLVAIADDSGIEVEALGGRPGVLSARYGGDRLDDAGRCRLLLQEMREVPDGRRAARYVAVAAVARPDGDVRTFSGACDGVLLREPRGAGGFGYDPIFLYPPFGATFAEIDEERKNRVSHRGVAFARLVAFLATARGRRLLALTG